MIDFFARHPTAGNLLMLFLAVLGFMALPELQRETFPEFDAEVVEVRVLYPGASAEDVEEAICQRIEDAIDGINDVNELTCDAREGVAIANVEMTEGGEIAVFMDDVKSEIDAINNFPENTEQPTVKELGRTSQVVTIAITGPMSVSDLKAFAEQTKDRLQQVPEISQVTVAGFSDHQLRIDVPERKLRQFGLSMSDIANTVARQGIDLPAGALETRNRDILLRFTDLRRTPTELEELIVVGAASGAEIRLGDIATITDRFELDEEKTLFNGQRAALLQVLKTDQQDTLVVMDAVKRFVGDIRQTAPQGVVFNLTQDRSTVVRDRLSLLGKNGAQGLVLVFLVALSQLALELEFLGL